MPVARFSASALVRSRHAAPLALLALFSLALWLPILLPGHTLLPSPMLGGFAPWGDNPHALWHILRWDSLGQYYPWRHFAGEELRAGRIPLWNPYQFSGTPFLANAQSGVLYPPNVLFWLFETRFAFGLSALFHTLLAGVGAYLLASRWRLSRAASLLAAVGFCGGGYLSAWAYLPTLSNTASWLPLLVWLLERANGANPTPRPPSLRRKGQNPTNQDAPIEQLLPHDSPPSFSGKGAGEIGSPQAPPLILLSLALSTAFLAGHPQIFLYCLIALLLRALTLPYPPRALGILAKAGALTLLLGGAQLLPTLELARLGHRAAEAGPLESGWTFVRDRSLQPAELLGLIVPDWPTMQGTPSENFPYAGTAIVLLALCGLMAMLPRRAANKTRRHAVFALLLALLGLAFALAMPPARWLYFGVPGAWQMGGVGRALMWWSLGASLLAACGLDALRARIRFRPLPLVALLWAGGELLACGWTTHPPGEAARVYPPTRLTSWLQNATRDGGRVLFVTPQRGWLPSEAVPTGDYHPPGVLPPNGATVYHLRDVNGYDSLAPLAYRQFVAPHEPDGVSPQLNGNMILLQNAVSPALSSLGVRYVVLSESGSPLNRSPVFRADGCVVYAVKSKPTRDGSDFYPGWRDKKYQPETWRFGLWMSLCGLGFVAAMAGRRVRRPKS